MAHRLVPVRASRLLPLCMLVLAGWGCGRGMGPGAPAAATADEERRAAGVILVVRHAETAGDDPRDPSLSDEGRRRAAALLEAVRGIGIDAVYTSQYRRTRDTGAFVAAGLGIPLHEVPISGDIAGYSRALLDRIDRDHAGGSALVIGHSNTAPVLVEVAIGSPAAPIDEAEFDRLFILIRDESGPSFVTARY